MFLGRGDLASPMGRLFLPESACFLLILIVFWVWGDLASPLGKTISPVPLFTTSDLTLFQRQRKRYSLLAISHRLLFIKTVHPAGTSRGGARGARKSPLAPAHQGNFDQIYSIVSQVMSISEILL